MRSPHWPRVLLLASASRRPLAVSASERVVVAWNSSCSLKRPSDTAFDRLRSPSCDSTRESCTPTSSCTCSRRDSINAFFASSSACAAAVWAPIASRVRTADCSSAARIAASRSIIDWARASSSSWRVCSGSGAGDRRSNVTMPTATTTRAATATMPAAMTSAVMCSSWRGGVTFPGDHPCSPRSERVREHLGELVSGLGDHHGVRVEVVRKTPRAQW